METKVMQVYYDSSAYPFKDQARETRYPVIGTSFTGASNTTRIRFYVNQFANIGTCTFVAITKLPSGKKLYEQLSKDTTSDTEPFVYLDISSAYTQEKGDIQIALNVYEGGVSIVVDSDSGLYTISGSPIITATGNIKISVAYTPYMDTNYGSVPTTSVQQALALVSGKLDETSAIVVVDNTDNISASVFTNGQMVYDKSTDVFYQVVSGEYVKQTLIDIAYEYAPSGSDVILTIKLNDGLGVYKTLTINLTTYLASLTYVNAHINNKNNPHEVTKAQVGLGNVVNTSDSDTPLQNGTTKFTTGGAYNLQVSLTNALNSAITEVNTNLKTYGKSLTIDETDFKLRLLDGNGDTLSTIDLPLEELIVDGEFDSETQTIILTLFNGNTIEIPVADLVAGLVSTDDLASVLESYYTKTQVDSLLGAKANSSDVYTQTQTNTLLNGKQDNLVSGTNIKTINNTSILGSGNYAFDSAFNELSTNALENSVVAKEFREINYEIAMIREALFEVVLNEIDYSVDYAMTYVVPDTLTDTDGTHRVVYSETQLVNVSGNSVVDNQLVPILTNNTTINGVTFTNNGDGTITVNGTATAQVTYQLLQVLANTGAYFIKGCPSGGSAETYSIYEYNTGAGRDTGNGSRSSGNQQYPKSFGIRIESGYTANNLVFVPQIFNITKMFPDETISSNDNPKIVWLKSRGYIAYNTGSLLSTSVSGIESKDSSDNTLSTITLPTTELKSAGSVHDYLEVVEGNVVEGEQRYNVVKHTLVGNYTFTGNEIWVSQSSGRYTCSETSIVSSIKMPIYGGKGNLICNGLLNVAQSVVENANGQIALTGGAIWVHDTNNITSSSTAQTYMAGKTIYFELASEPTPTTIATDLTFEQVSLIIQQGGTINTNFTNVPPNVTTTFVVKKAVGE